MKERKVENFIYSETSFQVFHPTRKRYITLNTNSEQKKPIKGRRSFREENYGTDVWTSGDITRWNWVRVKKFSVRVSTSNWMTFWAPHSGILLESILSGKYQFEHFSSRQVQCSFSAHFSRSIKCIDLFLLFSSHCSRSNASIERRDAQKTAECSWIKP